MVTIIDNVKQLITATTGYTVEAGDDGVLLYIINNEQLAVCNICNTDTVPDSLMYIVEETAAGRYMAMKSEAIIGADGFDVVSRISEGDTTVEISGKSAGDRFNELVALFTRDRMGELLRFRKLTW